MRFKAKISKRWELAKAIQTALNLDLIHANRACDGSVNFSHKQSEQIIEALGRHADDICEIL